MDKAKLNEANKIDKEIQEIKSQLKLWEDAKGLTGIQLKTNGGHVTMKPLPDTFDLIQTEYLALLRHNLKILNKQFEEL